MCASMSLAPSNVCVCVYHSPLNVSVCACADRVPMSGSVMRYHSTMLSLPSICSTLDCRIKGSHVWYSPPSRITHS